MNACVHVDKMCVCVCVCARARECVPICTCKRKRERGRQRQQTERERVGIAMVQNFNSPEGLTIFETDASAKNSTSLLLFFVVVLVVVFPMAVQPVQIVRSSAYRDMQRPWAPTRGISFNMRLNSVGVITLPCWTTIPRA